MSSFRILDPFQVYTDLTGLLAAGGNLHFYQAGTTTDADVYGDNALAVNNGATIAIGTDGRAVDDIWGDASLSYRCRIYAADGTLIRDRDNLSAPGAGSTTIPALTTGDFLSNDGTNLLWAAVRQALDPSGATGKIMGSDGTNLVWMAAPSNGSAGANGTNANVTLLSNGVKWNNGTGDLFIIQGGSASAPASGSPSTSASVTFPVAFKTLLGAYPIPTSNAFANEGKLAIPAITAKTTTGFTVGFDTNTSSDNIYASVPFDWIAFGTVAS